MRSIAVCKVQQVKNVARVREHKAMIIVEMWDVSRNSKLWTVNNNNNNNNKIKKVRLWVCMWIYE